MRVLLLVVVAMLVGQAHAAVVLCARPRSDGTFKTTVKIRSASCAAHETQLDAAALGLQGPPGIPGAPGPALVVKDATGATVGLATDPLSGDITVNVGGRAVVLLAVSTAGLQEAGAVTLDYTSNDCSGPPLMGVDANLIPVGYYRPGTHTIYVGSPTGTVHAFASESASQAALAIPGNCSGTFIPPDTCCYPTAGFAQLAPPLTRDVSGFVLPFHVEGP